MQNAKPTAPARCVGGGRCPRVVCGLGVRGIGLSTLNSQVSTKNHNNIVTNIPPGQAFVSSSLRTPRIIGELKS